VSVIYNRRNTLGLKLRHAATLRKLSRTEFFSRLQLIRAVDPITDAAYREVEDRKWRERLDDSPHGHPWHVSFHASQFPGDDPKACPRQALYRMMDLPAATPFTRQSRTVMSAGKSIELELVQTFSDAGILLSAKPSDPVQTGFEYPEAWLTGSVDCVILPPRWNKPLPIEIKTKYQAVIDKMKLGIQGPDDGHVFQIKVQLALVALDQEKLWPGLDKVTHGYIYYLSRDRPSDTAEFRVDLDERFFEIGVERLKRWRAMFLEDHLPSENPSKKHPMGWHWTKLPCAWCPFKKTCQLDHQHGVTQLSESVGIERAKLVNPDYSLDAARDRVISRWDAKITAGVSDGSPADSDQPNSQ
jgi:CRISPR/Cas system-associated exonuclease Cas4 (RecB family)